MQTEINRENYEKFIEMAKDMGDNYTSEGEELFTFNLDALARIVDVAYCEGQITELTRDESYSENPENIERLGALQTLIENALPEGMVDFSE